MSIKVTTYLDTNIWHVNNRFKTTTPRFYNQKIKKSHKKLSQQLTPIIVLI